jgi:hypothetical protein
MKSGAIMSAAGGEGEGYRFGRETYRAMGHFPAWAKALPRNPLFSILSFSLFCFYLKPFGKLSKLIQIETKSL